MYNPQLDTFIKVAELGSFSKAADALFITPTAVMKQINHLERRLSVTLFERTHQGIALTDAGRSLLRDSIYITKYCRDAVERARSAAQHTTDAIRIGVSPTTPASFITRMSGGFADILPGMRFQFVPFDNTPENAHEILSHLGQSIDIVGGIVDESIAERNRCAATVLAQVPVRLGMPFNHPLSMLDELGPEDLDGQSVMILRRGYMAEMDRVRDCLMREHPSCHIEDFGFYDTEAFNAAENTGSLIVAIDEWASINPLLRIVPVRWGFTLPFGILHAPDPSPEVAICLEAFRLNFR